MEAVQEPVRWAQINWRFHCVLYAGAQRPLILSLVDGLRRRVARELLASLSQDQTLAKFNGEHRRILETVKRRRAAMAAGLLDAHLSTGRDEIVRMLRR
jgi:DNA-binding GntR family transcriptional regulator